MKMDYSALLISDGEILPSVDFFRYLLLLKGKGSCRLGNQTLAISQHDVLTLPSNTEGVFSCDPESRLFFGLIVLKEMDMTIQNPSVAPAANTELVRKVYSLGLENQDVALPYYNTVNALINQLMFASLVASGINSHQFNSQVFEVINDINNHFSNVDYDVKKAIAKTGYTENHFRKLFQYETGTTPNQFITKRHLDRAADLFHQFGTHIPVKEIAWQCGYQDPYYFSRMFKSFYGVSPQQYVSELSGRGQ